MKVLTLTAAAMLLIVAIISFVGDRATWALSLAASGASLPTWFVYKKQAK
ncbi:hypothetical protein [Arthrobacter sp. efr-133-TYG-118]|nr:hypothetical protein [Arthrobacter sp. efr-133-TYG-118]